MRRRSSQSGSMLAELAVSFPMFIVFLIVGFETIRVHYNYLAAQIIANRGVDLVRTHPCCDAGHTNSASMADFVRGQLDTLSQGMGFNGGNFKVCITTQTASPNCLSNVDSVDKVGGPREVFLVRVQRSVKLAFGLKTVVVDAIGIGRHEPREA